MVRRRTKPMTTYQHKWLVRAVNERLKIGTYLGLPLNAAKPLHRNGLLESCGLGELAIETKKGRAVAEQRRVLTKAERQILEALERDGEVWFVPSQSRMVQRLAVEGRLAITDRKRANPVRGIGEKCAVKPDPGVEP